MSNGLKNKVWWKSKTIWLLVGQLLLEAGAYQWGELDLIPGILLLASTTGGFIVRYYTNQGIALTNNK